MKKLFYIIILIICFSFQSCSYIFNTNKFSTPIRNKGLVLLSDVNPYLSGNRFLSELAGKNELISEFLTERGIPKVIEINTSIFDSDEVLLYFPLEREHFQFKFNEKKKLEIFGPFRTKGTIIAKLLNLTKDSRSEPKLLVFHSNLSNTETFEGVMIPKNNTLALMTLEEFRSNSLKELRLNKLGDIIYVVKSDNENLRIISLWFTYSDTNIEKIAAINNINKNQKLKKDQEILIPSYMLKYNKEIPWQFFN